MIFYLLAVSSLSILSYCTPVSNDMRNASLTSANETLGTDARHQVAAIDIQATAQQPLGVGFHTLRTISDGLCNYVAVSSLLTVPRYSVNGTLKTAC